MKQRMILCTVVSILLCTILTACGEEQIPSAPEPIRITVMVDTKAEFPLWEYIRQKSGMEITLDIVPGKEICNTLLLRQATKQKLPDLVYLKNHADMQALVRQNLLLNFKEHMDSLSEYQRALFVTETPREVERMAQAEDRCV